MTLKKLFGDHVSSSAFQRIDGELTIVGKWSRVTQDSESVFDVWICDTADFQKGLGAQKIRNVISRLNSLVESPFHELNGETWLKVKGKEIILQNLPLLGIKKKKKVSLEHIRKLRGGLS